MFISILLNIIIIAVLIKLIATRRAGRLSQGQHVLFCLTGVILLLLAMKFNIDSACVSGGILCFTYALIGLDEQMKRLEDCKQIEGSKHVNSKVLLIVIIIFIISVLYAIANI
jgi:hypothetical protein